MSEPRIVKVPKGAQYIPARTKNIRNLAQALEATMNAAKISEDLHAGMTSILIGLCHPIAAAMEQESNPMVLVTVEVEA